MAPGWPARLQSALVGSWLALQVEYQGAYSLERAQQLLAYLRGRFVGFKTPLTLVLTPVPCVVALTLMDCNPLQDPSLGAGGNPGFLARSLLAVMSYTAFVVGQIHVCVPNLLRMRSLLWIAPAVAGATNGANYLMSLWIGFPLPFAHVLGLAPWVSSLLLSLWVAVGRKGRRSTTVRRAFGEHSALIMAQSSLGVVYPFFYRLFLVSGPKAQFFVVLLLPAIKLAMKFRIFQVTPHIQDLQPVTLSFNAEVFNSLFTASCIQGSSSAVTSAALMSIDFVCSAYGLFRLSGLVASVEQLGKEFNVSREQMPLAVVLLARNVPREVWDAHGIPVRTHHSDGTTVVQPIDTVASDSRWSSASTSTTSTASKLLTRRTRVSLRTQRSHRRPMRLSGLVLFPHAVAPAPSSRKSIKRLRSPPPVAISPNAVDSTATTATETVGRAEVVTEDQIRCVRHVLAVFQRTEYLLLVEYVEVIVPMVYGTYLSLSYSLPTRVYYPLLRDVDESEMRRVVSNIFLYGLLQLLSFVLLNAVLLRRFRIAAHHQLVQYNLVLWMVYTIQSSLEHVGMDYSFQFAWLRDES